MIDLHRVVSLVYDRQQQQPERPKLGLFNRLGRCTAPLCAEEEEGSDALRTRR